MITRRGANAAPDLSNPQRTSPVSEILRVPARATPARDARHEHGEPQPYEDEDLYGNMPFTD